MAPSLGTLLTHFSKDTIAHKNAEKQPVTQTSSCLYEQQAESHAEWLASQPLPVLVITDAEGLSIGNTPTTSVLTPKQMNLNPGTQQPELVSLIVVAMQVVMPTLVSQVVAQLVAQTPQALLIPSGQQAAPQPSPERSLSQRPQSSVGIHRRSPSFNDTSRTCTRLDSRRDDTPRYQNRSWGVEVDSYCRDQPTMAHPIIRLGVICKGREK